MTVELNKIHQGNVLTLLNALPEGCVDCVVTSPPYWALRDYKIEPVIWDVKEGCTHEWGESISQTQSGGIGKTNVGNYSDDRLHFEVTSCFCVNCNAWRGCLGLEPTFQLYLKHLLDIFDEVKRVLKPTGTVFVNLGDTYAGSGNGTNDYRTEESKSLSGKSFDYNMMFQGKQQRGFQELPDKSLCMIPYRFAIAMQDRGWILRNVNVWWKRNCMPSSVKDRFTVDFEPVFFFVKERKYFFDLPREKNKHYSPKIQEIINDIYNEAKNVRDDSLYNGKQVENLTTSSRGIQEFIVSIRKVGKRVLEREDLNAFEKNQISDFLQNSSGSPAGRAMRTVWDITTQPFKDAHFATFPEALPERCIKAGCPEFVCNKCGKPREKIEELGEISSTGGGYELHKGSILKNTGVKAKLIAREHIFKGFSDCGCNAGFSGGVILDPFAGAGTTCLVARKLGRNFMGFELNPEYVKMAADRIKPFLEQTKLEEVAVFGGGEK